jgi:hypothetical protein
MKNFLSTVDINSSFSRLTETPLLGFARRGRRRPKQTNWVQNEVHRNAREKFIPSYMKAGYGTYNEYLLSEEFRGKKLFIERRYPKSKYCWVCDCKGFLDLHHEVYDSIPNEKFNRDVFWVCDPRCQCKRNCHFTLQSKTGVPGKGEKLLYSPQELRESRIRLRKKYLLSYIKPTTFFPFLKTSIYRLIW